METEITCKETLPSKTEHPTPTYRNKAGRNPRAIEPPPRADPADPLRVQRSHLEKMEVGKSSGSCKLSLVARLHRTAALQEFWCASYEEACVIENLAAHPNVVNIKEQLTRVDFFKPDGSTSYTTVDAHVLLACGEELLVSVKHDEKARRPAYIAEIADISAQCPRDIANRFTVLSRYFFHPAWRDCARVIHIARRGWDPEADRIALEVASDLSDSFTLGQLVDATRLAGRGWRAVVRLLGDGDIWKHPLDPFEDNLICRRVA